MLFKPLLGEIVSIEPSKDNPMRTILTRFPGFKNLFCVLPAEGYGSGLGIDPINCGLEVGDNVLYGIENLTKEDSFNIYGCAIAVAHPKKCIECEGGCNAFRNMLDLFGRQIQINTIILKRNGFN